MIWLLLMSWLGLTAHGEPLSFAQAMQDMVDSNVNVRVQRTRVEASRYQQRAARWLFSPQLNFQAQQVSTGGNGAASVSSGVSSEQLYTLNANWNLFRSGADVAALEAARRDHVAQTSALQDSVLSAETSAAQALFTYFQRGEELAAYKRSADSAHHFLVIAQARFDKSLLSREELDKVALDAANSEARRSDAEIALNDARAGVESLLGHSEVQTSWPWQARLNSREAESLLTSLSKADAVSSRPDVAAAVASLNAESARRRNLFRALFPTVDLTYSIGDTHVSGAHTISGWSTTALLTIPLWTGLKDYTAYRVQIETQTAAEVRLQQLKREVGSAVKAVLADFRTSVQQYESRLQNLTIAKHILDQDAARFKLGRANANELNLDLSRVTDAEVLTVQGVERAHMAYVNLRHAFGQSGL